MSATERINLAGHRGHKGHKYNLRDVSCGNASLGTYQFVLYFATPTFEETHHTTDELVLLQNYI